MKTAAIAAATDCSRSAVAEIRQRLDAWIKAVGNGSPYPVTSLYAPDAILLATFERRVLTTPEERNAYLTAFKARKGLKAAIDECHIQILAYGVAAASGLYTFRYVADDGKRTHVKARFTFIYARQPDGEWLIAAHHSSVAPAANGNAPGN